MKSPLIFLRQLSKEEPALSECIEEHEYRLLNQNSCFTFETNPTTYGSANLISRVEFLTSCEVECSGLDRETCRNVSRRSNQGSRNQGDYRNDGRERPRSGNRSYQ